ncbi:ParE family toxin-like protein [Pseudorhizobium pelagicum]
MRIGKSWRALALQDGNDLVWFWIGSHADYDRMLR